MVPQGWPPLLCGLDRGDNSPRQKQLKLCQKRVSCVWVATLLGPSHLHVVRRIPTLCSSCMGFILWWDHLVYVFSYYRSKETKSWRKSNGFSHKRLSCPFFILVAFYLYISFCQSLPRVCVLKLPVSNLATGAVTTEVDCAYYRILSLFFLCCSPHTSVSHWQI